MTEDSAVTRSWIRNLTRGELPIILLAALVQGWGLYALHGSTWPGKNSGWLAAAYVIAVLVPLTVQMLAPYVRRPLMWMTVAVFAGFYLLLGWHYNEWTLDEPAPVFFILGIQWLLVMPFVQARLIEGRWRSRYELLFSSAWNNKLVLAEAVAFTGLFWLLLALWAQLFGTLGIRFFRDLFKEPSFIYPVTAVVFGLALQLIGSLDRLTKVLLEQTLNVLKWLALLAGLILGLFTVALIFELPGMISSGQRAIAASWLLWLIAVTVLLINAAYRDGSVERPYPRVIGVALRCVIPLTVIIAVTAVYALGVRIGQYGITVSRFWACVVAGGALLYSAGYALAVRDKARWMGGIAGVNVAVALYLIAVITMALSPILSPYRIAANSQFVLAQDNWSTHAVAGRYGSNDPLSYLHFDAGEYGRKKLEELSRIENHPHAAEIRKAAVVELGRNNRWATVQYDTATLMASMVVRPAGRSLDQQLKGLVSRDIGSSDLQARAQGKAAGVFVDLNDDATEEFVLLQEGYAILYRQDGNGWRSGGRMESSPSASQESIESRVAAGEFTVAPPKWNELVIGDARYRVWSVD